MLNVQCFLFAAALLAITSAVAQEGEPPKLQLFTPEKLAAWWETHPDPESWPAAASDLQAALLGAQKQYGLDRAFQNEHFRGWLVHLRWISLFPEEDWKDDRFWSRDENLDIYRRLSIGHTLPRLLIGSLDPKDDGTEALEILCRIAASDPEGTVSLPQLAVALAVVFDQEFPESWPHPFIKQDRLKLATGSPASRFAFIKESRDKGALLLDPADLSVRDLTFMVDSILDLTEFQYAQQVKLRNAEHLAELFPAVRYDFPRANRGDFFWPHDADYTLFEIGQRGGICADQAFFVAQTGKAKGVPTLFFLGQGRSGGHAWIGFLGSNRQWDLNVAKYRGENYSAGVSFDPQTWRRMTDAQFRFLIKELRSTSRYEAMQMVLQWAAMNREADFYRVLLHHARQFMPRYFATWELEAEWLKDSGAAFEKRTAFWRSWVTNFREENDLRTRGQIALLQLYRDNGSDRDAERIEKEILNENKSERFDLAIKVGAESIFLLMERGDWDGAAREYDKMLTRFRLNSGGHLFYNLVRPYVERCLAAGKREAAGKALEDLGRVFRPQANSMLDQDLSTLRTQVGAGPGK